MDAVKFIKEHSRLCAAHHGCLMCPIDDEALNARTLCNMWVKEHPEEAIKLIEKWSNENPIERSDNCHDND